jgi:hypothetical protein
VWGALEKSGYWSNRRLEFRGSGLPWCPRAFYLDRILEPPSRFGYLNEVVLQRGQAIHEVVQKWLGKTGHLFGNWECPVCKVTLGRPYVDRNSYGPVGRCPIHKVDLAYQEYALEFEGMTGHPDGLVPNDGREHTFTLLEIKTQGHFSTKSWPGWCDLHEPMEHHFEQANAYACIIPAHLGFKITKGWIWYISADRPRWKPKVFEFTPEPRRLYKHIRTMRQIEKLDLQKGEPPAGTCKKSALDPWCAFAPVCLSPMALIQERRRERSTQ